MLSEHGVARVLGVARYEFVARRVPDQALLASEAQTREFEQFPPQRFNRDSARVSRAE